MAEVEKILARLCLSVALALALTSEKASCLPISTNLVLVCF